MRLIDADALKKRWTIASPEPYNTDAAEVLDSINEAPTVDAVQTPCKIGDCVYAIRNYKGVEQAQQGIVSEMFFTSDMELCIVVRHIARGKWGKTVFATSEECERAIKERRCKDEG